MRLSPEVQTRLAVFVPIIALLLSLFFVYPAWGRYSDLRAKIEGQKKELADLQAAPLPAVGRGIPAVSAAPDEPPKFLGDLASRASAAGVRVVGFDIQPSDEKAEGPIRSVRAKVDVEGQYFQVRQFLFQIADAPRLYVVTDMAVTRAEGGSGRAPAAAPVYAIPGTVRATFTLERYVTPPAGAAGEPAA